MKCTTLIISLLVSIISCTHAQKQYFLTQEEGKWYSLEDRLIKHQVNGASTAIIRNFELDTTIQLGFRDKENELEVNEQTLFQMGSMTGALTNFAVVRLASEGKINLDAAANDYLESWKIEDKKFTKNNPDTVHHCNYCFYFKLSPLFKRF